MARRRTGRGPRRNGCSASSCRKPPIEWVKTGLDTRLVTVLQVQERFHLNTNCPPHRNRPLTNHLKGGPSPPPSHLRPNPRPAPAQPCGPRPRIVPRPRPSAPTANPFPLAPPPPPRRPHPVPRPRPTPTAPRSAPHHAAPDRLASARSPDPKTSRTPPPRHPPSARCRLPPAEQSGRPVFRKWVGWTTGLPPGAACSGRGGRRPGVREGARREGGAAPSHVDEGRGGRASGKSDAVRKDRTVRLQRRSLRMRLPGESPPYKGRAPGPSGPGALVGKGSAVELVSPLPEGQFSINWPCTRRSY